MTIGVGGSTIEAELANLKDMTAGVAPISLDEYQARIQKVQGMMQAQDVAALYVNAGTNMRYFTGTRWGASERMVGAIIPASGDVKYIAPDFEIGTLEQYMIIKGDVASWDEHEDPYALFVATLSEMGISDGRVALDPSCPMFLTSGLVEQKSAFEFVNGQFLTQTCRAKKSDAEIAIMTRVMEMTLEVHKAAARILKPGITTTEVEEFIHTAHKRVGAPAGNYFVIVLFGEATQYPHGVKDPQTLKEGDMVLIDTGCMLHNYISDITRTYVYGEPTDKQREVWNAEKDLQATAFEAAKVGIRAGNVDLAVRARLKELGFGPDYALPGVPHRTGHGIGMDIHEGPYLNSGEDEILDAGMCFSNEPMLCIPGEFGIRLEDHFYLTEQGPKWFTQPSHSIDNPFG
ncbi:metallopeptidase [Kordiimonas sediminis]|uniref:Metallopeptidase n=1 Tax=Kordiimonas sediminis TaxID=1735581 RepID=A0A919ASE0_9PROT|nr:Xaa-Pro peptidase family protein [Kordiimonas sediminis]GHF22659.1 metallopeptidase [Kordiimonas sediminis]